MRQLAAQHVSSASNMLRIARTAAPLPLLCPAHTCREPHASITSCLVTLISHFPIMQRITSLTLKGHTFPSPLSSGIRWLARIASMLRESTYSVNSLLVIVAIAEQRYVPNFLKDLQANIRRNPLGSTPDGPLEPFVFGAASLSISSFICWKIESGTCSVGPNTRVPSWASCASGRFSRSCFITSSVRGRTPPLFSPLRYRRAELICPDMTRLAKTLALSSSFFLWELVRRLE